MVRWTSSDVQTQPGNAMPTRFLNHSSLLTAIYPWFIINAIKYCVDLPNWTQGADVAAHPRRRVQLGAPNWIAAADAIVANSVGSQAQAAPAPACEVDSLASALGEAAML
jgi:hypothetical protein